MVLILLLHQKTKISPKVSSILITVPINFVERLSKYKFWCTYLDNVYYQYEIFNFSKSLSFRVSFDRTNLNFGGF